MKQEKKKKTILLTMRQPTYGKRVGQTVLPNAGDELHHFGWNACSSALCPDAPHPHIERRYLVVPGIRSFANLTSWISSRFLGS